MDDNDGPPPDAGTSGGPEPATAQPAAAPPAAAPPAAAPPAAAPPAAAPPAAAPPEPTGHARVDEALQRLTALDDMPVGEHVAVVEDIHRTLQDALAEDED